MNFHGAPAEDLPRFLCQGHRQSDFDTGLSESNWLRRSRLRPDEIRRGEVEADLPLDFVPQGTYVAPTADTAGQYPIELSRVVSSRKMNLTSAKRTGKGNNVGYTRLAISCNKVARVIYRSLCRSSTRFWRSDRQDKQEAHLSRDLLITHAYLYFADDSSSTTSATQTPMATRYSPPR